MSRAVSERERSVFEVLASFAARTFCVDVVAVARRRSAGDLREAYYAAASAYVSAMRSDSRRFGEALESLTLWWNTTTAIKYRPAELVAEAARALMPADLYEAATPAQQREVFARAFCSLMSHASACALRPEAFGQIVQKTYRPRALQDQCIDLLVEERARLFSRLIGAKTGGTPDDDAAVSSLRDEVSRLRTVARRAGKAQAAAAAELRAATKAASSRERELRAARRKVAHLSALCAKMRHLIDLLRAPHDEVRAGSSGGRAESSGGRAESSGGRRHSRPNHVEDSDGTETESDEEDGSEEASESDEEASENGSEEASENGGEEGSENGSEGASENGSKDDAGGENKEDSDGAENSEELEDVLQNLWAKRKKRIGAK